MLDILIGVPPNIHPITATFGNDVVWIIGILAAFVLLATAILWEAARQKRQSQMKEAQRPGGGEQQQVHAPEEGKILLRR